MSVYVDGKLVQIIKRSTSTTKYQQRWDYPGTLSNGIHNVQLVFVNANGTFDAVIIPSAATSQSAMQPASPTPVFTQTAQPTLVAPTDTPVPPTIVPSNTPVPETSTPEPTSTP